MKDIELFNDHFQNFKAYGIPKAQLIIADVPYNLGANAYASNPAWYVDGDNKNGESALAGKQFFDTDKDFRPAEFMHFCSQMLRKDKPIKEEKSEGGGRSKGGAACMILFCPFEQMHYYIELGQRYGLKRYIPLVFRKDFSAQVLKANMKVVGNCEYRYAEDPPDAETRSPAGTPDRDIHRQRGCSHRPVRRKRNNPARGC